MCQTYIVDFNTSELNFLKNAGPWGRSPKKIEKKSRWEIEYFIKKATCSVNFRVCIFVWKTLNRYIYINACGFYKFFCIFEDYSRINGC